MTHPNNTVFPTPVPIVTEGSVSFCENFGLNLRQHFAIECLNGLLANSALTTAAAVKLNHAEFLKITSEAAVDHADALIAQLNKIP